MSEKENYEITEGYNKEVLLEVLKNFDTAGESVNEERNRIKRFKIENDGIEKEINVKCFSRKSPFIQFVYKYFKGSKGKRSYLYGKRLTELKINTPEPIAYFDEYYDESTGEKRNFYICENLKYQFTCRELLWREKLKPEVKEILERDREKIIGQFAGFTFDLHEKGVEFDDYSPGNVLIRKEDSGRYGFYLIDLNRMTFRKSLDFNARMKNVSRMMEDREYVEIFSKYYSELYKKTYREVYDRLYSYINRHKIYVAIKDNTRTFRYFFKKKKR